MPLTLGSVSVSAAGAVTGSGAALRLYNKRATAAASVYPGGLPTGPAGAKIKQGIALFANADAEWMFEEMTLNAQAKIPNAAAGDGLQTQADPVQATTRPASDKFLSIV
jgi:hypothetical protein